MSTPLKFEFDFDEVFEGIKQGIIRELAETNFDAAKNTAVNQIKSEIKEKIMITYKDESELKNEIEREILNKVYSSLMDKVNDKYLEQFDDYMQYQLKLNPHRLEKISNEIKNDVGNKLYDDLYSSIRNEVTDKIKDMVGQMCDLIGGNSVKVQDSDKIISKEEYEDLLDRDRMLSALEAGGVDNWEWYDESLRQYYEVEE